MAQLGYNRMGTLGDVARYQARSRPQSIAFKFEERETSFSDFDRHTNRVANALISAGLKPGDRISYFGKNSDHYFELVIGAAKAGVIMVPVGWRLSAREALFIIHDAESQLLFVGPEVVAAVQDMSQHLMSLPIIAMETNPQQWTVYEPWRDVQPDTDPGSAVGQDDVTLQLYTSGTTGNPKGAMLTHRNILEARRRAAEANLAWYNWTPDDVSLVAMPVAHIGGTGWGITGLYNGAKGIVAREFDPTKVLDFIEHEGVSKLFLVPAAMQIIVRLPRARQVDYSRLRYILYGAAPIPLDLLRECIEVFGCGFCQQYGMTETSGTIAYLPPEDHDPVGSYRMRGAGVPMPGVELRILDGAGSAAPPYTIGEVAIRAVSNMAGYWKMPEATRATLSEDGWLRSGDAGYLDKDGYLFIHDRIKDLIISGGENIYPAEVENAIYGHPAVSEVAVIGVPHERWGEAVKAIIVPNPGATTDPADILAFARAKIAAFKVPKAVEFVDALPRNAAGKILRRELRDRYWGGRIPQVN